jgi:predicted metal-dependent hydrolase
MRASSNIIWSSVNSEARFAGGAALKINPSARAKVMRLTVDPRTGEVLLTVPKRVSLRKALAWADTQRAWVEKALAEVPPPVAITPGMTVPLYGLPHRLDWSPEHSRIVRVEEGRFRVGGPLESLEARVLRWLQAHAREVLTCETREYAQKAGVTVSRVGVGDPVSRWGSCSESGAIRYSWRLILAPEHVRRATVAHEVAHRIHMNHGRAFHALVKRLFGADPAPARHWLKREGAALHRFGRR